LDVLSVSARLKMEKKPMFIQDPLEIMSVDDYAQYLSDMVIFGISFWRVDEGVYIRVPPMDVYKVGDTYEWRDKHDV